MPDVANLPNAVVVSFCGFCVTDPKSLCTEAAFELTVEDVWNVLPLDLWYALVFDDAAALVSVRIPVVRALPVELFVSILKLCAIAPDSF